MEWLTTSTILQIAQILSILGGGAFVAFRLGRSTSQFESAISQQGDLLRQQSLEISELKTETKKLGDVLTKIAVQENRLDRLERDIYDLRRGRGLIEEG